MQSGKQQRITLWALCSPPKNENLEFFLIKNFSTKAASSTDKKPKNEKQSKFNDLKNKANAAKEKLNKILKEE